jgi:hypothetical protein
MIFCTISSASHLIKCQVLAECLRNFGYEIYVFQTDRPEFRLKKEDFKRIDQELKSSDFFELSKRYQNDKLRWALKPLLLKYAVNNLSAKAVYIDNDFYFLNSPSELEVMLDESIALLTPHGYQFNPSISPNWFEANFRVGLYNAGFVAVNKNANELLAWWANSCIYSMKKSFWRGLFNDQKYLDIVPILFKKVEILDNTKYNVAGWNDWQINSPVLSDQVVCIHFADITLRKFSRGEHLLNRYSTQYERHLLRHGFLLNKVKFDKRRIPEFLYFVLWKFSRMMEKII